MRIAIVPFLTLSVLFGDSAAAESGASANAQRVSQIVAHRGASLERPECTLSSIRRSIEVGATAVEIDIRTSKDLRLFILHDETLDRTTDGKGVASELTLAELKKLDAGSWFDPRFRDERIPSLREAAEASKGKIDLLLDLKEQGDDYDRRVVEIIRKHGDPKRTIIGVRSVEQAVRFRKQLPDARQLALIPEVATIEAFADAGVDFIRLWPRWLENGNGPVERVRATGCRLHLNGTTGSIEETLGLLVHRPDSLSSDNPHRQRDTLKKIADGKLPPALEALVEWPRDFKVEEGETGLRGRTFLNRDYEILELPNELEGLPRLAFDGGAGSRVSMKFRKPAVVFAVFNYNDTGAWAFADGRPASDYGWHRWRADAYRGSSNPDRNGKPNRAAVWFREFEADQELSGLPAWWLCLGVADLETARGIAGFREGLVSETPPVIRRFSHAASEAEPRPLNVPEFDSAEAIRSWQAQRRKRFIDEMLYPYPGKITVSAGESIEKEGYRQEEFHVALEGERLFRYFRLAPDKDAPSGHRAAVVCFMGHGKVRQILEEEDSYQHACAARFAREGYLVFAMENVGMEPGADTHHDLDRVLRLEGRGWYSLLFAHQRILLDRVFADPLVDTERVGVAGVSTGGLLALSAAVMEPRIAAASVQGIFGSMRISFIRDRNSHCSCGAIPGLLPDFDLPELALLVAPRPLHISNGEQDGFPPQEAQRCLDLIQPIYLQAGGEKPLFTTPPGGHAFAVEPAIAFFRRSLE
jgi:glycerophosphoryl diester phosphodiesterase